MSRKGSYVNNAMNRSLGRVGMAYGSAVHSSGSSHSSSVSSGTYVDNSMNRSLGRVGMEHGAAVHSRSSASKTSSSSTSPGVYVDNALNRSLGRVGMEHGTVVHSRSSVSSKISSTSESGTKTYGDNHTQGRVGQGVVSRSSVSTGEVSSSTFTGAGNSGYRTYADNAYNRRLGRVGKALGTHVISKVSTAETSNNTTSVRADRTYVDNAMNRKLGRVGMLLGSMPHSSATGTNARPMALFPRTIPQIIRAANDYKNVNMPSAYQEIEQKRQSAHGINDNETLRLCDQIEGILNRFEASKTIQHSHLPSWLKGGDVIDFAALEIGDRIGGGGFGDVHVAIWKGETVCVKVLRVQRVREQKKEQFQSEVKQMSSLNHPAIVHFYGACVETPKLAIVMEFMKHGSLHDAIHLSHIQFNDTTKLQLAKDMLSALEYIHDLNVVHRDVKSCNVLLCDDMLHCKLADFGFALKEEVETNSSVADHTAVGTLKYSPFEVLDGERLTVSQYKAVDVYSTAVTILELMTEQMPFDGMNQHQVRKAVQCSEHKSIDVIEDGPLKKLLVRCLDKKPSNRPSASVFKAFFENTV